MDNHHITSSNIHTKLEELKDKVILISGGTTGIGRATAVLLGSYGAKLLIFGRHEKELADAMNDITSAGGNVHGIIADQSKSEDIKKVFEKLDNEFGKLDILINNAALGAESIEQMDLNDWHYIVESNLLGYMGCTKEAIERMKLQKEGHIVFIGSMSADEREGGSSVYVATKAGVQGFAEAIRKEVNKYGIKVTLIEPGRVGTDMQKETPEEQKIMEKELKMLKAQDIAVCVYYCLTQPKRCDVVSLQIRPHLQEI